MVSTATRNRRRPVDGATAPNRQQELISMARDFLMEFYTRLSTDPTSLPPLYLDQAEVIYAGSELNKDAVLTTGRSEIEEFFRSAKASRFKHARVSVEAVHPLASPLSPLAVQIFAKGRVWLNNDKEEEGPMKQQQSNNASYVSSHFCHWLTMAPQPKTTSWDPSQRFIANEYFYMTDLPLELPVAEEGPLRPPIPEYVGMGVTNLPNTRASALGPTPPELQHRPIVRDDERTLHAMPSGELKLSGTDLVTAFTAAIQRVPGCQEGICTNITRPRTTTTPQKTFFFIHFDSVATLNLVKQQGTITVDGISVTLSSVRSRNKFKTDSNFRTFGNNPQRGTSRRKQPPRERGGGTVYRAKPNSTGSQLGETKRTDSVVTRTEG